MQFHGRHIILILVLFGSLIATATSVAAHRDISRGLPKRAVSVSEVSKDQDRPVCPCTVLSISRRL